MRRFYAEKRKARSLISLSELHMKSYVKQEKNKMFLVNEECFPRFRFPRFHTGTSKTLRIAQVSAKLRSSIRKRLIMETFVL